MKEPKTSAPSGQPAASLTGNSQGITKLLRGAGPSQTPGDSQPDPQLDLYPLHRQSGRRLLRISLVLADILLVGLAVFLVQQMPRPLGFGGIALCVGAMVIGAWLACLALWLDQS